MEDQTPSDETQYGLAQTKAEQEAAEYVAGLDLQEFTPAMVNLDSLIFVVGKRRFGKSVWCEWLLSHLWPYFREAYVFTNTKFNKFWQQHVAEEAIYQGLEWDAVTKILNRQKVVLDIISKEGTASNVVPWVLMIFEDVASERSSMRYSEDIARLAFNGRQYKVMMIFMIQDLKAINADVRANVDFAVLTYQNQERTMESAQADWGDWWSNRHVFKEIIRQNCQDHGMLVIAQPKAVYNPTDALFLSRATDPKELPPYRLGFQAQWDTLECTWEDQLKPYMNLRSVEERSKMEWLEICQKKLEEQEKARKLKMALRQGEPGFLSNQFQFAPEALRDAHSEEVVKSIGKDAYERGEEILNSAVVFTPSPLNGVDI